ncbi:MAG: copper-translocating P-type ATPase [Magnetococcales bacterium]|nr:copper-translocating P-type ATPase [Magnetococcales bacterium]
MVTFPVGGMSCASCSGRVERALSAIPGVERASVNLTMAKATVVGDVPVDVLISAVREIGFQVPVVTESFAIQGLSCASCAAKAERALTGVTGVMRARVNLASHEALVAHVPDVVTFEGLQETVQAVGFTLVRTRPDEDPMDLAESERLHEYKQIKGRLVIGAVLLIANMAVMHGHWHGMEAWLQFALVTPVQFWVGWPFHVNAWSALRHGGANMHSLVTVGTFSAYLYSVLVLLAPDLFVARGVAAEVYFETSGMIIVLILLGRFLEIRAKGKTSQAIRALMGLTPKVARVVRDGQEMDIPLRDVVVGDSFVVRPGEKIPVDGIILKGHATLDESMLTGEAMPVERGPGEALTGGTINRTGSLIGKAVKVGRDTALARIVEMVREAQGVKPPIARLADQIAAIFVPVVMGIALVTFGVWYGFGPEPSFNYALLNFVAVLIIACPCALGLATPTSILVGTGKGAEHGILIRGGDALETAHKIDVVVFDKTGTLTMGKPVMTDWIGDAALLKWVASAERRSEHPIAEAVVAGARERGMILAEPSRFVAIPGQGVRAEVEGHEVVVGTVKLMVENSIDCVEILDAFQELQRQGKSAMLAAVDGTIAGVLAVSDRVKPHAGQAVLRLQEMGVEVVMLTGDGKTVARAIADQLGIRTVLAEVLPQEKEQEIQRLQATGKVVAMVGDGINDSPALARADVGIAMGTGTDVAMEASDITLVSGDPRGVATAIQLSRATMRNIRQNLFWAFAYNVVLIPLAAGVWFPWFGVLLSPIFAAFAMSLSSVTVVSNALRLRRFRVEHSGG